MSRPLVSLMCVGALAACARQAPEAPAPPGPPNVVLLVGDGFGLGAWSAARAAAASAGEELALERWEALGFLEPGYRDGIVTDCAAAASAWATGRSSARFRVGQDGTPNLFERLREAGYGTGLVTTARVTDATPAPFYGRTEDRWNENDLAVQLLEAAPDVVIGGGARHFLPRSEDGRRSDGRDLLHEAEEKGTFVTRALDGALPPESPVLALLAMSHLPHELDRGADHPDLSDLALAAVRRLGAGPWFLLVEEARIDHAGHDHDGPGVVRNTLRLDRCLAALLAEVDLSRTLVLCASDHAIANPTLLEIARPESLDVVTASVERMERLIFQGGPWEGSPRALRERALPVLDEGARHTGLSSEDLDRLLRAEDAHQRRTALGNAVSRRLGIAFLAFEDHLASSGLHGHHADLVPLAAWGPRAAEVRGVRDHAELGRWIADVLELKADAS